MRFSLIARARPVSAGQAESLSFVGPNESNQSKGPEYDLATAFGCKLSRLLDCRGYRPVTSCSFAAARLHSGCCHKCVSGRPKYIVEELGLKGKGLLTISKSSGTNVVYPQRAYGSNVNEAAQRRRSTRERADLQRDPKVAPICSQKLRSNHIEAIFFGDFLLSQQKKVTRRPAATGALSRAAKKSHVFDLASRPSASKET